MTEGTSPPVGVTPIVQRGELAQELSSGSKLDALLGLHLSHLQLVKEECEQKFQLCWELVFQRLEPRCLKKNAPVINAGRHQQAKLVTVQLITHTAQSSATAFKQTHLVSSCVSWVQGQTQACSSLSVEDGLVHKKVEGAILWDWVGS